MSKETQTTTPQFYTTKTLWAGFVPDKNLQPNKVNEVRYDKITYSEYFFSGRAVNGSERVRIFGVYATPDDKKAYNAILYIPDVSESPNFEMITEYVRMGYAVLAVDLCGKTESKGYCTVYPESISYANYQSRGNRMETVEESAKETSWYEWVCVCRNALNFLFSQSKVKSVGVIGVKDGSNLAWILAANDNRIRCSVMMFGAGWQAYRGHFLHDDSSAKIALSDEKRRFIAALDAHAYAPYVHCPVLYLTATNNERFDLDRGYETICRIPEGVDRFYNCAPGFSEYLDTYCQKDVELFLKKYLDGRNIYMPKQPKIEYLQNERQFSLNVQCDGNSEVVEIKVFCNEGVYDPAVRNWMPCENISDIGPNAFEYYLNGETTKIFFFAVVKYKSGITVASKVYSADVNKITSNRSAIIYSSKDGLEGIAFNDKNATKEKSIFVDQRKFITLGKGAEDIYGAYSQCGLISYRFGEPGCTIDEHSIIKLDVFASEFCIFRLAFLQKSPSGAVEYHFSTELKASNVWKNLSIDISDFKTADGLSIKDYSQVYAMRIDGDGKFLVNNILLI